MSQCHPINIHNIFTSPNHNYFTRKKFDVGESPTIEHSCILLEADKGLKDDRFEFSKYPVTFFSLEVAEAVCTELEMELDVRLFRRNIIISGIHLNSLIGKKFTLGEVEFEGLAHCAPCTWMNSVMKKGAYALMAGRGGLRARVLKGGVLSQGKSLFYSENYPDVNPLQRLKKPQLPSYE